jgi:signal transduction histidine kinase
MVRSFVAATFAALLAFTGSAFAQTSGTADEAKALLNKAVAALKADPKKAIADFNEPAGGFRDRDLYVFCAAAPDYNFTAHPKAELRGTPLAALVDKKGKKLGEELIKTAAEDKVGQVEYFFPRPGGTDPVEKVTFVTKVGGQVCGVGYYK